MLTEKEVSDIYDKVVNLSCLIEKYDFYLNDCNDGQIKETLSRHRQILQNHYHTLMGIIHGAQMEINPGR